MEKRLPSGKWVLTVSMGLTYCASVLMEIPVTEFFEQMVGLIVGAYFVQSVYFQQKEKSKDEDIKLIKEILEEVN